MNKHDNDNLSFILSLSEEQFANWFFELDSDDIEYACELLQEARVAVSLKVMEVQEVVDTAEASAILKKFML